MANNEIFLDAAYAIALSVSNDQHHEQAMALRAELQLTPKEWGITDCVSFVVHAGSRADECADDR